MLAVSLTLALGASVTIYHNLNAVFGRAAYKADKGVIRYLGSFNLTADCEAACLAYTPERCQSFAFHQPDMVSAGRRRLLGPTPPWSWPTPHCVTRRENATSLFMAPL